MTNQPAPSLPPKSAQPFGYLPAAPDRFNLFRAYYQHKRPDPDPMILILGHGSGKSDVLIKWLRRSWEPEHTSAFSGFLFESALATTQAAPQAPPALLAEVAELRLEIERLKTRVAEERRVAIREIHRADQATSSLDKAIGAVQERAK